MKNDARHPLASAVLLIGVVSSLPAATITVTGTGDTVAVDGAATLREAINSLNAAADVNADVTANRTGAYGTSDTILFHIPGAGAQTIQPLGQMTVNVPVLIDGYSQPGASANTLPIGDNSVHLIEIDGSLAGPVIGGVIQIGGGNSKVQGLVLNRAQGGNSAALQVIGPGGNTITGVFIGLDPTGTLTRSDLCNGLRIEGTGSNTIGGPNPGDRNVVSSTIGCGANFVIASDANVITNNYFGTNSAGTVGHGSSSGIYVQGGTGNMIGLPAPGLGNVISSNVNGILLTGSGTVGTLVQNNVFGTSATGSVAIPNQTTINIFSGAHDNVIGGTAAGTGNIIANSSGNAVLLNPSAGTGNRINGNSIYASTLLAIDLNGDGVTPNDSGDGDTGPNNLQNYPVLTSASSSPGSLQVVGTLDSTANTSFRVEFFANPACHSTGHGEGRMFLGFATITTDGSGHGAINALLPLGAPAGYAITSTATDPGGNTSEFSGCVPVIGSSFYSVIPCRVADTRGAAGPYGGPALAANADRTFVLSGQCGIPSTASAVSFNFTITQPTGQGDLRVFPAGGGLPLVSTLNWRPGQTRANNAIVGLGAAGDVTVHPDQATGTVHLIVDVNGYFQ